jgi:hypothetical protein
VEIWPAPRPILFVAPAICRYGLFVAQGRGVGPAGRWNNAVQPQVDDHLPVVLGGAPDAHFGEAQAGVGAGVGGSSGGKSSTGSGEAQNRILRLREANPAP